MDSELISDEEYENLPDDPREQFIEVARIFSRKIKSLYDEGVADKMRQNITLQYMTAVASAAEALEIDGITYPNYSISVDQSLESFKIRLSKIVTGLRFKSGSRSKLYSVKLAARSKSIIELKIEKLREIIKNSDIPEERKRKLFLKIDELNAELNNSRLNFAKVMSVIAYISGAVAVGTSFLADAPDAIATITSIIGKDKDAEEKEFVRLNAPEDLVALPSPSHENTGSN